MLWRSATLWRPEMRKGIQSTFTRVLFLLPRAAAAEGEVDSRSVGTRGEGGGPGENGEPFHSSGGGDYGDVVSLGFRLAGRRHLRILRAMSFLRTRGNICKL